MVFQEMLRHSDFLRMAAFTTGASTMDITPTSAVLNSTGTTFKLYGEHFGPGAIPLAVDGNSPQPAPKHDVGYDHPQVRAGSPTWPLDILAGLSPDGRTLRIGIVNATLEQQPVAIKLKQLRTSGSGTEWLLTGSALDAQNKVGAPPGVTIQPVRVPPLGASLMVPAKSASIFEYPVDARR
jgi:alpha-N-arabinofuranosidase